MHKFLVLMVFSSLVALAAPSVFERYEAAMLSGEVEELDPAPSLVEAAAPAAPRPAGRTTELQADRAGHFRTDARLNGQFVPVLVDTGATLVALDETTARRLGVAPPPAAWRETVRTANGEAPAARTRIARVSLGPIEITNVDAIVLHDGQLPVTLLGMSFLNRLDGFSIENGRLVLRQ
ncbi:TIGR02281 family clan AA aspartic protease [Aurantimonas sp. VKM B-3413]|uniref:retropepsin-like aspartic protease family protein n=1 Tax=Aurantimonas sp. VKM B-3413 TaxID=2779401 RepID=UPI001E39D815|nr:TIGR02281 family clan AA aspartic protease [Aurantimonas sp. VKM B-3413]MCB8840711.1 TIGR02281 family clan AA aspartic protease [Aurantimonas sp. VKM B-3413]